MRLAINYRATTGVLCLFSIPNSLAPVRPSYSRPRERRGKAKDELKGRRWKRRDGVLEIGEPWQLKIQLLNRQVKNSGAAWPGLRSAFKNSELPSLAQDN
jgi:hypothetical protein